MKAYLVDPVAIAHVVLAAQEVSARVLREYAVDCGASVLEALVEKGLAFHVDASEVQALRAKVEEYEARLKALGKAYIKADAYETALQEIATHDPECSADGPIRWARGALARFNPCL